MYAALSERTRPATVRAADAADAERIFDTLRLAFAADPVTRWFFPDPQQYAECFPQFAKAFGGGAIANGTAFVSEDGAGAALWLDPDAAPDEQALAAILELSVPGPRQADAAAVFEEMGRCHPDAPHWYLPLIGVEPARQGLGHGSGLMRRALRLCDALGLPAYLEASSTRSLPFYQSHGFEIMGAIRRGGCPPLFPMLRAAQ